VLCIYKMFRVVGDSDDGFPANAPLWSLDPTEPIPSLDLWLVHLWPNPARPHNPTSQFWSSPTSVVTAESFSDRPGPL